MRGLYLAIFMLASPAFAQSTEVAINTPEGQLQGTLEQAEGPHAALILPGSGPTDRDGNQLPLLHSDVYRLLAEALAAEGVTTLRIDKRGIGGSFGDPNAVSLDLYAQDTAGWIAALRAATGADCVWLLGHSEGAIIAMHAAESDNAYMAASFATYVDPSRPLHGGLIPAITDFIELHP